MQLANMGKWFKDKLASMRSKDKSHKTYTPPKPHYRLLKPWWIRNSLHYTAGAIARGRTLNPHAVAQAMHWRANRIGLLTKLAQGGMASPKELRELHRISH